MAAETVSSMGPLRQTIRSWEDDGTRQLEMLDLVIITGKIMKLAAHLQ